VDGEVKPISDYPRMENPYTTVPFGETRYVVADRDYELVLDFDTDQREVRGPFGN
jgi:hypothetical protein